MGTRTTELTHTRLWAAIDSVAAHNGLSPSALARRAGLSSTAFNKSKRVTNDGRPRWPSTESIAKILEATGADLGDFVRLIAAAEAEASAANADAPFLPPPPPTTIGFAEGGAMDRSGSVRFPGAEATCFAFSIEDATAAPLYRPGDVVIASLQVAPRRGDRVLVQTRDGRVTVRLFVSRNHRSSEFATPGGRHRRSRLPSADVVWVARILWASQ